MAALLADVWDSPGGLKVHNIIIHNIILIIITFFISEGRGQGSGTPETPEIYRPLVTFINLYEEYARDVTICRSYAGS